MKFNSMFSTVVAMFLAIVLLTDVYAACPDQTPDPLAYCQNTAKVCSFMTQPLKACNGGVFINGCGQNVETRTPGPFQPMYGQGSKVKAGPQSLCVMECLCALVSFPNKCLNSCVPNADPLECQATLGDTVIADGSCFGE